MERFNRTLQSKYHRYMTARGTYRYVDKLNEMVDAYNATHHRSIGMAPKDVTEKHRALVLKRLYGKQRPPPSPKFAVGNQVRTSHVTGAFTKGYKPRWTQEVFRVRLIKHTDPPTYLLSALDGEEVDGAFYEEELQLVRPRQRPHVILDRRWNRKGERRVLVKTKGGKRTWISERSMS